MLLAPVLEVGGDVVFLPVVRPQMHPQPLPACCRFGTLRWQAVQRRHDDAVQRFHRQLRGGVEGADGFHLVAKEFEAPGPPFAG